MVYKLIVKQRESTVFVLINFF